MGGAGDRDQAVGLAGLGGEGEASWCQPDSGVKIPFSPFLGTVLERKRDREVIIINKH